MDLYNGSKNNLKDFLIVILFITPAFSVYSLYVLYSIGMTFYYSFFQWSGIQDNLQFIGLSNYINLFLDSTFWLSLKNNLILVIASLFIQLPMGLIMALLLFAPIKGTRLFRTVYFMPFLMSTVAIALLFIFILDPNFGLINQILGTMGLGQFQKSWLGESDTALWSVLAVICWQFTPFYMILYRAAIVGIPEELYEAATIDGANSWRKFLSITLPLLIPTTITCMILSIVGSLKYFDLIYIMTNGGPNHSTELMATYMYKQAFTNFNMGYGSTISFMMFTVAFIITIIVIFFGKLGEGFSK